MFLSMLQPCSGFHTLEGGGENRMIAACETHARVHAYLGGLGACPPSPPQKILNLDPLRLQSGTNFPNNIHILMSSNM